MNCIFKILNIINNMNEDISDSTALKRKKGRPRKYPLEEVSQEPKIKNKRGRKKKEQVEVVEKQKKKRGRKAAVPYLTNSIRRQFPSSVSFPENDQAILYLNIKDTVDIKKDITYDVLSNNFFGTVINTIDKELDSDNSNSNSNSNNNEHQADDILCEFIDKLEIETNEEDNKELNEENITTLYDTRLQIRKEQDLFLMNKLEILHKDETLLNKVLENVDKIHNNTCSNTCSTKIIDENEKLKYEGVSPILKIFIDNKDNWLNKTDVNCWWCCHSFDSIPIGLPVDYGKNYGNKDNIRKFRVKGVFCSFACMIAYAEDNKSCYGYGYGYDQNNFKTLTNYLYKKMTGGLLISKTKYKKSMEQMLSLDLFLNYKENLIDHKELAEERKSQYIEGLLYLVDETLHPAPLRSTLKIFGGNYSIEEFRSKSKERKICKMINYPLSISRDYHEEVDIKHIKIINDTVFNNLDKINVSKNNSQKLIDEAKESKFQQNNNNVVVTKGNIDQFISFN
jgi:hypothetical protein